MRCGVAAVMDTGRWDIAPAPGQGDPRSSATRCLKWRIAGLPIFSCRGLSGARCAVQSCAFRPVRLRRLGGGSATRRRAHRDRAFRLSDTTISASRSSARRAAPSDDPRRRLPARAAGDQIDRLAVRRSRIYRALQPGEQADQFSASAACRAGWRCRCRRRCSRASRAASASRRSAVRSAP